MANSDGGDLVYGVEEAAGVASSLVPTTSETFDEVQRRLGQVLTSGIEPRLQGLRLHQVACDAGFCTVIRVPASFDGPHRYLFNGHSRFVMRNGTHTTELTYQQLRGAFDRTASLADQAMSFIRQRTKAISAGNTWRPIEVGPVCVVHVVPIASIAKRVTVDITGIYHDFIWLMFDDWGGASRALNLDGVIAYPSTQSEEERIFAYTQAFRNGAVEAVRFGGLLHDDRRIIPALEVTQFYRSAVLKILGALRRRGISGPAILQTALLKSDGYELQTANSYSRRHRPFADRTDLILPDIWIDSLESEMDVDLLVRPLMDILWQSFNIERCAAYAKDGRWTGG